MKRINWLDHFANLLVVILGISIAFYLEGYKEEKNRKSQERQYLENLSTDLQTDIKVLDTLLSVNEEMSNALTALSNATVGVPIGNDSILRNYILIIQYNPPLTPQRTTYESLKASGQMDLIGSFELRNDLVELYEQYYRGTGEYDAVINEHVRDFIKPFYMHHVRYTSTSTVSNDFLSSNEFRNMIFAYRFLFLSKDEFYRNVRDHIGQVKSKLDEYIAQL